ncbi:Metalloenzyme, LuxS/M16 peptidase-like protein [Glomus cerebriforme]|uniref:Metalloenzyme, LuxS/M16 peptidase-like protein n=1 Tax=Glomus cerebriforme TaxID=658196 RepID=A0A397ST42_9GLOM|nr:Metalloenzyme, LuxS/M16 peptidase-like protein [Glomus cerebriforme]
MICNTLPVPNNQFLLSQASDFVSSAPWDRFLCNKIFKPKTNLPPMSDYNPPAKRPDIIKNTQICRLWYKKDNTFWVPKANICLMFKSPLANTTPIHHVRTRLYTELVKDALNEYLYNAEIAGVSYNLNYQIQGLVLRLNGYNDKLPILLEKIVIKMKNLKVDPERFSLIKERIQRGYKNSLLDSPHQQSTYYLNYLTNDNIWTNEEKLEVLENIKYEDIEMFYPELLGHLFIESLIHGNILKDDAIKMLQKVEEILQPKALLPSQLIGSRSVLIPEGKKFIYQRNVFDINNINSAIEYYIQIGDPMNKELRTKSSLVAQIANEPCFDQLRTKEQLGYIVTSGTKSQVSSLGFKLKIQSERDSIHLENRIEDFLNKLQTIIENMSEQEYQKQIQSLIVKKLEKPKNLSQESFRYWNHIKSGYYDFEQVDTDVEELRKIEKQDLLEFYKKFINPNSPVYKKLSVHLRSQKSNKTKLNDGFVDEEKKDDVVVKTEELELELKDYNEIINDMVLWKSHMKLGPTATPVESEMFKSF